MPDLTPRSAPLQAQGFFRQPLAVGLSIILVLALVVALWAFTSRSSLRSQLERDQVQRADLAQRLGDLQSRVASVELVNARTEQAKEQFAEYEAARKRAEEQLVRMQVELRKWMEEDEQRRSHLTAELGNVEESLRARGRDLADVGERLLAAQRNEAELRTIIDRLNGEAAEGAAQVASAERRLQEAQQDEAQVQEQLLLLRTLVAEQERRLGTLTHEGRKRSRLAIGVNGRRGGGAAKPSTSAPERGLPSPVFGRNDFR